MVQLTTDKVIKDEGSPYTKKVTQIAEKGLWNSKWGIRYF
jgi:hypothetical protein